AGRHHRSAQGGVCDEGRQGVQEYGAVAGAQVAPSGRADSDIFSGKESANGTNETQTAERGHTTLQPLYSRRNQPSRLYGWRATIRRRRSDSGRDYRSIDAELRGGAASVQDR